MKRIPIAIWFALLPLLAACGYAVWDQSRTYPTPATVDEGYEPRVGDVVFQSLPPNDLIIAIEGATGSPYSHCGIVAKDRGRWVVVEAISPVIETPLERWIARGRGGHVAVYRLDEQYNEQLPAMVEAARGYLGRPYDFRYRMDDQAIYCSELVYKSFKQVTGKPIGRLVTLGDLDWEPYEATIRKYEGGDPPLDRKMITPRDLARAEAFTKVYDNGLDALRPLGVR